MIRNIEYIRTFYESLPFKNSKIREMTTRPLTLAEKLLACHFYSESTVLPESRGKDYLDFKPDRVAMQDATAQMAVLQFMVAGLSKAVVPASIHCDHLIIADAGLENDLRSALEANREVYDFLFTASRKYGIDFWEPGSGIIHQLILENYAFPGGMLIGADSHTPNPGGLGMLAVGVGGADVVDVMAGMSWELKFPLITGVKLTGRLNGWASPKDVILKMAGILSVSGSTGHIIEYFGEGAESLSATGKATICNMGAETGATASLFGYDDSMSEYLAATGRKEVADYADRNRIHLVADPEVHENPDKYYDRFIEINLSEVEPLINGPYSPDKATQVSEMKKTAEMNNWPIKIEAGLIGSCTNSSWEDLYRAASVVKDALAKKLSFRSEFYISPGSEQVRTLAEQDGLLDLFRQAGGIVLANACGPCIGQWKRRNASELKANTIIHSFNRNFSGRADGNPNTHAFVASPEIVTALSLAGELTFNPASDFIINSSGNRVRLSEPDTIALTPGRFGKSVKPGVISEFMPGQEILIQEKSDRLQVLKPFSEWDGRDFTGLPLLIKAKGKCTTDHISMAGPWLRYRGHLEKISENYMIGAVNSFNGQTNHVMNQLTGVYQPVHSVARQYRDQLSGSVVAGEYNFGEGSSREHAAMEPRFLGVKAIIVKSFARIHETNLKKQGVLTLTFSEPDDYEKIKENDRIDILGLESFSSGRSLKMILHHGDGSEDELLVNHSYSEKQILWFKAGSALNLIRKNINQ